MYLQAPFSRAQTWLLRRHTFLNSGPAMGLADSPYSNLRPSGLASIWAKNPEVPAAEAEIIHAQFASLSGEKVVPAYECPLVRPALGPRGRDGTLPAAGIVSTSASQKTPGQRP